MPEPTPSAPSPSASAVHRLRRVGWCEGVSFLVLIATMPLKHRYDLPQPTRIAGSLHGALFIAYVVLLAIAARRRRWGAGRVAAAFAASVLPFGTFALDRRLRRWADEPA